MKLFTKIAIKMISASTNLPYKRRHLGLGDPVYGMMVVLGFCHSTTGGRTSRPGPIESDERALHSHGVVFLL